MAQESRPASCLKWGDRSATIYGYLHMTGRLGRLKVFVQVFRFLKLLLIKKLKHRKCC